MINTPNTKKNRCAHPDLNCKVRGGSAVCDALCCIMDEAYEQLLILFNHDEKAVQEYIEIAILMEVK